jgi:hypothetical protein
LPAGLATPVPMARLREIAMLRRDVLHPIGWRQTEETDDLLPDFLRLASGTLRKVTDFASRWGPLWLCAAHANCAVAEDGLGAACVWSPLEPIAAWRREAQAAKAVLEIASRLNVEAVPYEVWQRLEIDREQYREDEAGGRPPPTSPPAGSVGPGQAGWPLAAAGLSQQFRRRRRRRRGQHRDGSGHRPGLSQRRVAPDLRNCCAGWTRCTSATAATGPTSAASGSRARIRTTSVPIVVRMAKQPNGCGQHANAPSCRRRRTCRRRSYKKSSVSDSRRGDPARRASELAFYMSACRGNRFRDIPFFSKTHLKT